jgi:hypothetical protein
MGEPEFFVEPDVLWLVLEDGSAPHVHAPLLLEGTRDAQEHFAQDRHEEQADPEEGKREYEGSFRERQPDSCLGLISWT